MQALRKRHIKPGYEYDRLFPKSTGVDTVIKPKGKAKLHHTINLIKEVVLTTLDDTKIVAPKFKAATIRDTCRHIWQFVYEHFQYELDKKGIEQVRRPSRMWKNRLGDCDCMTVMISSILTNLDIPHKIRITKYSNKLNPWLVPRYQHIYPIVPVGGGKHITMDCVTDWFDYEVPYYEKRDFEMNNKLVQGTIEGLPSGFSGVDSLALRELVKVNEGNKRKKSKENLQHGNTAMNIKIMVGDSCNNREKEHSPAETIRNAIPSPSQMEKNSLQTAMNRNSLKIQSEAASSTSSIQQASPVSNTRLKKPDIIKNVLITGAVVIGTYQLIKILT